MGHIYIQADRYKPSQRVFEDWGLKSAQVTNKHIIGYF